MIKISKTILVYTSWKVSLHLKKDLTFKIIFQNLFQNSKHSEPLTFSLFLSLECLLCLFCDVPFNIKISIWWKYNFLLKEHV